MFGFGHIHMLSSFLTILHRQCSAKRGRDYSGIALPPTFKWLLLSPLPLLPSLSLERGVAVQERRESRDYAALEVFVV